MSPARNDLCSCRKTGAWRTREAAVAARDRILATSDRWQLPTGVERCPAGVWHLTSKLTKRWAKGKLSRRRAR